MNSERRHDKYTGGVYSRSEFIEFYGGTDEWDSAGDEEDLAEAEGRAERGRVHHIAAVRKRRAQGPAPDGLRLVDLAEVEEELDEGLGA